MKVNHLYYDVSADVDVLSSCMLFLALQIKQASVEITVNAAPLRN